MRRLAWWCGAALLLAGCATAGASSNAVTAVATVYPLAWIAQSVAPHAQVILLSGEGNAHGMELSPSQRAGIEQADVVLHVGDVGFMPQVEQAVSSATGEVVSAAGVVGKQNLLPVGAASAHEAQDHAAHAHAAGAIDPHLWLDPGLMARVALRAGDAFAAADPERAAAYEANAGAVADELTALDSEIGELLGADCPLDEVIVSHEAYAYLLEPHGKSQHGVADVSPEAGASAAELAELVMEISRKGIRHVLAEPVEGRSDTEAVAREAGVELLEISPLERVPQEQRAQGYPALLRSQARTFATALGCG